MDNSSRNTRLILIRTESGPAVGIGHMIRCLALAQSWVDRGGKVAFLTVNNVPSIEEQMTLEGIQIFPMPEEYGSLQDAKLTAHMARQLGADWVVVDGYHFDSAYQRKIKDADLGLLTVDDYGQTDHYFADIVLNQNISADEAFYKDRERYTKVLLGTHYALLRREFLKWQGWIRGFEKTGHKLVITLGGGNSSGTLKKLIDILNNQPLMDLEIKVLLGPAHPDWHQLQEEINKNTGMQALSNVMDIAGLLAWADAGITTGGSTSWEVAFMGLPSLLLILSENQRLNAERMDERGAAINLGDPLDASPAKLVNNISGLMGDPDQRRTISFNSKRLVDGCGAARVTMHIRGEKFYLRHARDDDERIVWEWANDPVARGFSFNPNPIPWETHTRWYRSKIKDQTCIIYLAINDLEEPIGLVRFDLEGNETIVSINLDKKFRGKGIGSQVLKHATEQIINTKHMNSVQARIKPNNIISQSAFLKAGYRKMDLHSNEDQQAFSFIFEKVG